MDTAWVRGWNMEQPEEKRVAASESAIRDLIQASSTRAGPGHQPFGGRSRLRLKRGVGGGRSSLTHPEAGAPGRLDPLVLLLQQIRVVDDGRGFTPDDLSLAFASHATSKLAEVGDLDHIASLGFRGEALASVGSVSRAMISSRALGTEAGSEVR